MGWHWSLQPSMNARFLALRPLPEPKLPWWTAWRFDDGEPDLDEVEPGTVVHHQVQLTLGVGEGDLLEEREELSALGGGACGRGRPCQWRSSRSLLEAGRRVGVWPDYIQVLDGTLSFGLPSPRFPGECGSLSVCSPSGIAGEACLKKGLPARSSSAHLADHR